MEYVFGLSCVATLLFLAALTLMRITEQSSLRREVEQLSARVSELALEVDALRRSATATPSAPKPSPPPAPAPAHAAPVVPPAVYTPPPPVVAPVIVEAPPDPVVIEAAAPTAPASPPDEVRAPVVPPAAAAPAADAGEPPSADSAPPEVPADPEPLAARGAADDAPPASPTQGWEAWFAANVIGVLGALAVVLGVGFLTVYAALRMPPSGRFAASELFAAGLLIASLILSRAAWSTTLALTVRSAAAAVALLGCVASSTYTPMQWIDDPRLALVLVSVGVVGNLIVGWRSGRQAFAAVHTVLSLAALTFSPADPSTLAVAGLVALGGAALALRRPDWDLHAGVGAAAWTVFHLVWWARSDGALSFVWAHALPVALIVGVGGMGLAVSYVRVPSEPPAGASQPARAVLAHTAQWLMLAANLIVHQSGGYAAVVLLGTGAAITWVTSARAARAGIGWLHTTDRLASLALAVAATLSLSRRGLDGSTVLVLLHVVPAAFVVLETRARHRVVAVVASALLQLASVALVAWISLRTLVLQLAETFDLPTLGLSASPSPVWDAVALTAAAAVVAVALLLAPQDDEAPPEAWLLSWPAPLLALVAGLRVLDHGTGGALLGALPLVAVLGLRARARHPLAGVATVAATTVLAAAHLLLAPSWGTDSWVHLLPALAVAIGAAAAERRPDSPGMTTLAHAALVGVALGVGAWTVMSATTLPVTVLGAAGPPSGTDDRWLAVLAGGVVAVGALLVWRPVDHDPTTPVATDTPSTPLGLDLSFAVLLATAVQAVLQPLSPARAIAAVALLVLLAATRAVARRVDLELGHALGLLLVVGAVAPRVLHHTPSWATALLGIGTAAVLVVAALTPPAHARDSDLSRLPTFLAWAAALGLAWRFTLDTSSLLPGVLWIVLAVAMRAAGPAWGRLGGDVAASTLRALALTTFVLFTVRHGLVDLQHEARLGPVSLRGAIELYAAAVMAWWALASSADEDASGAWLLELALALVLLFVQLDVGPAWRAPAWLALSMLLVEAAPRLTGHARVAGLGVLLYGAVLARVAVLSSRLVSPEVDPWLPPWLVSLVTLLAALGAFARFRALAPTLRALPVRWEGHLTALAAADPVKALLWPWFAAAAVYLAWVFDSAMLTVSWGALSLALFAAALGLRDRPSRRLALGALLAVLARLLLIDLRETDVFVKALVFLGVGGVLLAVSLLASRFLDRFDPPDAPGDAP